ncbi:MAG: hypothetical protein ACREUL_03830 [Steroidobacteraceae bacterium]
MKKQARNHGNRKPSEPDGAPAEPTGAISGEFVTGIFEHDGGRQVTVYVPSDPPEAIVFAGDGQQISRWGRLLEKADVPTTMIAGVHGLTDETLRLHEYSPGFEPVRFAAHEKFFVEEVRRWTASRFGVALPTERTAMFGVSAGGRATRCSCGGRHERASWIARWRILARRVPVDGGVGIRTLATNPVRRSVHRNSPIVRQRCFV